MQGETPVSTPRRAAAMPESGPADAESATDAALHMPTSPSAAAMRDATSAAMCPQTPQPAAVVHSPDSATAAATLHASGPPRTAAARSSGPADAAVTAALQAARRSRAGRIAVPVGAFDPGAPGFTRECAGPTESAAGGPEVAATDLAPMT